jgi:hypothetical protein
METVKSKKDIMFSVVCPHLKRTVFLKTDIWQYKILRTHPEVTNCCQFIEQVLSGKISAIRVFKKKDNPKEFAFITECVRLQGRNKYLRIGVKLINGEAVVATAFGVHNIPLTYWEEIR